MYTVAVRELCEFAAKTGDLDHRFTPSPSAQEGIAGHQIVAGRRGQARRSEVSVSGDYKQLRVRGRADGLNEPEGLLEEVKTYRGDLEHMPANHRALHWAQAKVYAVLLCRQLGLQQLKVSLVYFEIGRQEETVLVQVLGTDELECFFAGLCESFLAWAAQELEHRQRRDRALSELKFPYADFRAGQRQLAENVFRAARLGRDLLAQAPTGIGKTMATLFPMLKACAAEGLDKVFYLTAKGAGQQLAGQAIAILRESHPGLPLRVIELVARDKSCEHPDKACHGESCPLARGFYDRMPAARSAAIASAEGLDRDALRRVARESAVCPYYLTQELVRWSDVVIADYNYFFDSTALLHLLTLANQWKVTVLVDEAHNLLDRARSMYSAELGQERFEEARRAAPAALRLPFKRLQSAWSAISKEQAVDYAVYAKLPERLEAALGDATAAITSQLAEAPTEIDATSLRFYFDALHFNRLAETFGTHSMFDVSVVARPRARGAKLSSLCIRNVVPASFLRARYAAAQATVLFSATLSPQRFYADMLGLRKETAWLEVETPFQPEQFDVRIVDGISTRWHRREASLVPIARLMAKRYACEPGNYLAFFSSFDYMERAADAFRTMQPDVPCWIQSRSGDEETRSAFLRRFELDGSGLGFAVLGGAFAEGIDLPGTRLIGAFIATLGLPQVNAVNEEMRRRLQSMFGAGYEYTYLIPGLRKVVQAAGRVIRTSTDRGSVHLIDSRFADPAVRACLPAWWRERR
jgi:DNA excision repair protein ERCC-2